jgi:hypothetical protein
MSEWTTHEEYTAKYGTQEEQAAVQAKEKLVVDGPWRLVRLVGGTKIPLDNSVRSTSKEIKTLQQRELERTGLKWDIERYD